MRLDTCPDDEITVIDIREELDAALEPPALPFPLVSRKRPHDDVPELRFRALSDGLLG